MRKGTIWLIAITAVFTVACIGLFVASIWTTGPGQLSERLGGTGGVFLMLALATGGWAMFHETTDTA